MVQKQKLGLNCELDRNRPPILVLVAMQHGRLCYQWGCRFPGPISEIGVVEIVIALESVSRSITLNTMLQFVENTK